MSEVNWEYIIDTIKSEKCVLVLGPEVAVNHEGAPLHEALGSYLGVDADPDILYFNDDDFFLFRDETAKFPTYLNIQKFYNQTEPSEIYTKIAQIPFHLIVSLSPDMLLKKVMEANQIPHNFEYYRKYENPRNTVSPSRDVPLIYNLFGSIEDDESLIFTHDDMFDFLEAVLGSYQLPKEIKNQLKSAKNYILLGFTFEKWYVKLILRLFNLHSGRFLRYASKSKAIISAESKELYENHFRINFIEKDLNHFINKIYTLCEEDGQLRELGSGEELNFLESVRNCIKNDELQRAIDQISDYLELEGEEELLNDLVLISGSYKRLLRRISKGTVSEDNAEVKMNQIRSSLYDITEEIKELQTEDF